ncbi:MAG: helix-turn-helix transcriptional regulator [Nocardioidaceae bacterium]|nr:helix-turn-helix transcriptional regulator [Nocardioidaceae bacterium]
MSDEDRIANLRAGAHPLRLRILSLLTGAEMSAAEIARELDITHANASYHLRVLADAGQVVEAGEERIRGGVAKRYRHPWQDKHIRTSTPEERELVVRATAEELVRRSRRRRPRTKSSLTDAELWVTPEVWQRVFALAEEASTLLHAEARPPRTKGTVHVNMTAVLFQMTEEKHS